MAKVLRANENFLGTMGYRADQLASLSHRDFCTPALVGSAEYREFWNQLRAGQFVSGTFQRRSAQGQNVWLEASYNPVVDEQGRVVKVVKYALDVTAKVASEAETRGRLAALDRAMAVIEFDLGGNILTANDNFLNVMNYTLAELKGKHHRMFCEPSLVGSSSTVISGVVSTPASFSVASSSASAKTAKSSGWKPATTRSTTPKASCARL